MEDIKALVQITKTGKKQDKLDAMQDFSELCEDDRALMVHWDLFLEVSQKYPNDARKCSHVSGAILETYWASGKQIQKIFAVHQYFDSLFVDFDHYVEKIKYCLKADSDLVLESTAGCRYSGSNSVLYKLAPVHLVELVQRDLPPFYYKTVMKILADRACEEPAKFKRLLKDLLCGKPEFLEDVPAIFLEGFLSSVMVSNAVFESMSDALRASAARSKLARACLISEFLKKRMDANLLKTLNWLTDRRKAVRGVAIEIILQKDPPPMDLVRDALAGKLEPAQRAAMSKALNKDRVGVKAKAEAKAKSLQLDAELEQTWYAKSDQEKLLAFTQAFMGLIDDFDGHFPKLRNHLEMDDDLITSFVAGHEAIKSPFGDMPPELLIKLPQYDLFSTEIFAHIGARCEDPIERKRFQPFFKTLFLEQPELIASIKADFIPFFLDYPLSKIDGFNILVDHIKPFIAKSGVVRDFLAQRFAKTLPIGIFSTYRWWDDSNRNIRKFIVELLLSQKTPPIDLLQAAVKSTQLKHEQITAIVDKLKQQGVEALVQEPEEATSDFTALLMKAKTIKIRKTKFLKDLWEDDYLENLAPLNEDAVRWLLSLFDATAVGASQPAEAVLLMSYVDTVGREKFCTTLVNCWIKRKSVAGYGWIVNVIGWYGGEHLIERLRQVIGWWQKGRRQSFVCHLMDGLAAMDTPHSLACIYEVLRYRLGGNRSKKNAIRLLNAAATSRNLALIDLYDQLVPDFGLTAEGLMLDVGARTFQVTLLSDLSLTVTSSNGEVTNTLPQPQDQDDPALYQLAQRRFAYLRNNLSSVIQQQKNHLREAMLVTRLWSYKDWYQRFIQHPVMSKIVQGLIFIRFDTKGSVLGTFRLLDDGGFINLEETTPCIGDEEQIALWHPVYTDDETQQAWKAHCEHHDVTGILPQRTLPKETLTDKELAGYRVERFNAEQIPDDLAWQLLRKWGYTLKLRDGKATLDDRDHGVTDYFYKHFYLAPYSIGVFIDGMGVSRIVHLSDFCLHAHDDSKIAFDIAPKPLQAMIVEHGVAFQSLSA